ncbi:MAG: polysaccharide pyruvyl transferase family protein [Planctomycetota bacterium]
MGAEASGAIQDGATGQRGAPAAGTAAPRLCLFGAAPDTSNLGVSALFEASMAGILQRLPEARITVFDNGWGLRTGELQVAGRPRSFDRFGGRDSKRVHRVDSLHHLAFCCRLGGLWNPGSRRILGANAVLDISGGDSFTDLYGMKRFRAVVKPKQIAVRARVPLILLPQTYGPFADSGVRRISEHVIRGARAAWARDEHSYGILRELLGSSFDPARHRCGVDVAFRLPVRPPRAGVPASVQAWFDAGRAVVGFNVSGLIYADPDAARGQYGFRADYRRSVEVTLEKIMRQDANVHLLLVPHVKSDLEACQSVAKMLTPIAGERVAVLPLDYDQGEIKSIIRQLSWFCGTRMHSTIAGLSTGVPTAALAYSDKTRGVFETCDQQRHVVDPRQLDTDAVIAALHSAWEDRDGARARLAARLPAVLACADDQMDAIAQLCCEGLV